MPARVVLLEGREIVPGESMLAQFRFEKPVYVLAGDRLVVRDWPETVTLAGGRGIDPHSRRRGFRGEAQRELLEETGYRAGQLRELVTLASSAGLTDECVTLFMAEKLEKVGPGGGDASEEITVHEIPRASIDHWLSGATERGAVIDSRVYAALHLLQQAPGC